MVAPARRRAPTIRRLELATGDLATAAVQRMDETLPWYRAMSAEDRSWVNLVMQAGIAAFVEWFRDPVKSQATLGITADVFGTAPRELARAVTLAQTVEMVRTTVDVVEEYVHEVAAPGDEAMLAEAVLRYSREVAFAAAQIYAQAAEARGAWDARLEALVVDAVMRGEVDEVVASRAAALGWGSVGDVIVLIGRTPAVSPEIVADSVQRVATHARVEVISGVQGDLLVLLVGGARVDDATLKAFAHQFGDGPVVVGPVVADLGAASASAAEALAGLRAAPAWPDAPRPVAADALLPERALNGDDRARQRLVDEVFAPLATAAPELLDTLTVYLDRAGSLEGAARILFVHPNTVRYRLRRVSEIAGYAATNPRGAHVLRTALALGRLGQVTQA
jgi:DNA-binding PucR family transcriptional regulator